ncbi:putative extracellular serine/threonine protein kinase FAM20C [Apostichopus japonicus]|uniref:Putative extracellular serine/threonine protein kinase FAM20C n=1 Tax=Stichopus japonicus TaxID=307972 RepID=A0A2G8JQS1_STIJA|nr:putative extracellular serine/threonine protein kinase FAM20C [Apostichopus japonicus]
MKEPFKPFLEEISLDCMYSSSPSYMPDLLNYLSSAKISNVEYFNVGTQVKFIVRFEDGNEAIAKPKRHPRDVYWAYDKNQPFWLDEERHTSEIAAFHLDRILNYRRVIPCAGRRVNFTAEVLNNTKDPAILRNLTKKNGNNCFIGDCVPWFCNKDHMICDEDGGFMELVLCQKIPGDMPGVPNPWSQGPREAKVWKNKNICKEVLNDTKIQEGRYFLDLMELALFDHLIVNYDRHHIPRLNFIDTKESFLVINDNGKGFGNPFKDDVTFLAPIYQCCRFRNSTYQHILSFKKENNSLGTLMKLSLSQDSLAPILTEPFFATLDRRLSQFYFVMSKCLETHGEDAVLV